MRGPPCKLQDSNSFLTSDTDWKHVYIVDDLEPAEWIYRVHTMLYQKPHIVLEIIEIHIVIVQGVETSQIYP